MTTTKHFDAADAKRIDKQYAAPTLVEQRRRTLEALGSSNGETILDIGCGPAYLTQEIADLVGPRGRAIGLDTSAPMLAVATARCRSRNNVHLLCGNALSLPFDDSSIDAVVGVQVYLFVHDLERAFAEVARVLKPGGRTVIVDTDWDSLVWHSGDPDRMNKFIDVWKRRYVNATVARLIPAHLRRAGLILEHADAIPIVELMPDEASYSGSQISEVAKYVGGKGGITLDEASVWKADIRALADRGDYFFALNRYLFVARKPG